MVTSRVSPAAGSTPVHPASVVGRASTPVRWALLAYPPVVLLSISHLGGTGTAVATIALAVTYCAVWFSRWSRVKLTVSLVCALVLPLALVGEMGLWSAVLSLPVLGPVGYSLRAVATAATARQSSRVVSLTSEGVLLSAGLVSVFTLGLFVDSAVLLLTVAIFGASMAFLMCLAAWRLRTPPLDVEAAAISVTAGTRFTADVPVRTRHRGHAYISDVTQGVELAARHFTPLAGQQTLSISMTPRLAGPTELNATVAVVDPLGLVGRSQTIKLAGLEVIPLARIAEHAARLFLEGGEGEATSSSAELLSPALANLVTSDQGTEYAASRMYLPGDSFRALDWKHSARMHKLVVKVYEEDRASSGLLAFNRIVSDVDEADRAVYELVSAGLTAARMSLGVALTSYEEGSVGDTTGPLEGRELVRACLQMASTVRQGPRWLRFVRLVGLRDVSYLKNRVAAVGTPSSERLRRILELEERAVHASVKDHPLTGVLRKEGRSPEPGWVMVISNLGHDGAAATSGARRLEMEGVATLVQDVGALAHA